MKITKFTRFTRVFPAPALSTHRSRKNYTLKDGPSQTGDARGGEYWQDVETRSDPPEEPPAGMTWEFRYEPIDPKQIHSFYRDIQCRNLELLDSDSDDDAPPSSRGPLFVQHNYAIRRVEHIPDFGYMTRVLLYAMPGFCGLERRRYTGVGKLPTVPPPDVAKFLEVEARKGIPRTYIGVSQFQGSRLGKCISRHGLRDTLADVDMCKAHIQFRVLRLSDEELEEFPIHVAFSGLDGLQDCEELVAKAYNFLALVAKNRQWTLKDGQRLLLAVLNQVNIRTWLKKRGVETQGLDEAPYYAFMMDCKDEGQRLHVRNADKYPDLHEAMRAQDKWNPELSVTCMLDEHDEVQICKKMESLLPRYKDIPIGSTEHDGVTFFNCKPEDAFRRVVEAVPTIRFALKPLDDPRELALQKYPKSSFGDLSQMPTQVFFDEYQLASSYVGWRAKAFSNDLSFTKVVLARCEGRINRHSSSDVVEFWDPETCSWVYGKAADLFELVGQEVLRIWAPRRRTLPGMSPQSVPEPFNTSTFLPRIYASLVKLMPPNQHGAFDENCRYKLLFQRAMAFLRWFTISSRIKCTMPVFPTGSTFIQNGRFQKI